MKKFLLALIVLPILQACGVCYITDDTVVHHIKQFKEAMQELAGGPSRSYLKETIGFESCTGEVAYIDAIEPNLDAGEVTALANQSSRYTYDQRGAPTQAELVADLLTRNDSVVGQRTHVSPLKIGIAKWFDPTEKNFLHYTDPTSRKMKALMAGYFTKEDMQIMKAMFAATQQRGKDDDSNVLNVAMPADQVLADLTYANVDINIFSEGKERFLTNYVGDETIYCGMGPKMWKALVQNSGDKLNNQDYVSSAKYFEGGELPNVYGVVPLVHPLFDDKTRLDAAGITGAGEEGVYGFWTENGLTWAEFSARNDAMQGPNPFFKNQCVSSVDEQANSCRNDDLRVVQGTVTTV